MAIYHLHVKNGSRAGGQSAHAHAQYVSRDGKYSRERDALVYAESGHMPAWTAERELDYWDAADLYERANGQLYKEVEFALPVELSAEAQRELALDFTHQLTDAEQLPYTLAIHAGQGTNPHCHLMISERANDGLEREPDQWFKRANRAEPELGGALKTRTLQTKDWLVATREAWAEQANQALERAGELERIDHRSLAAQGIDREPGVHLGPTVHAMELRGIQTERAAVALSVDRLTGQIIDLAQLEEGLDHERARLREREIRPTLSGPEREGPTVGDDDGGVARGREQDRGRGHERDLGDGRAAIPDSGPDGTAGASGRAGASRDPTQGAVERDQSTGVGGQAAGAPDRAVAVELEPGSVAGGADRGAGDRAAGRGRADALLAARPAERRVGATDDLSLSLGSDDPGGTGGVAQPAQQGERQQVAAAEAQAAAEELALRQLDEARAAHQAARERERERQREAEQARRERERGAEWELEP